MIECCEECKYCKRVFGIDRNQYVCVMPLFNENDFTDDDALYSVTENDMCECFEEKKNE